MEMVQGKRLKTLLGILLLITVPVVLIVTSWHKNNSTSFSNIDGFLKILDRGRSTNSSESGRDEELFNGGYHNGTTINGLGVELIMEGREEKNVIVESEGKTQNRTITDGSATNTAAVYEGSKNDSLTSTTNNSTSHSINNNHDDNDELIDEDDENHKLIDGLLASGFDESSCISRFESHLYRKPSPHKPSPYLISKLRKYESIHRRCGPNTRSYKRAMKKITSSKTKNHHIGGDSDSSSSSSSSMCKYIVWTPANGLGNRIISISATFLYALLTDRVLLVRFNTDMLGLFCEPFLNSTWTLPKNSPFWNLDNVETYQRVLENTKFFLNNSLITTDSLSPPHALFLNLAHTKDDPEKFFHCDQSQELLKKVSLLILQSDQYFVPSLFMIQSFSIEITKMFPEKDTIFHHLGRYLFQPSNEAWGKISRFYESYLERADERIGLQIRLFSPNSTPHQAVMNLILNCTIQNNILPQLDMKNSVSSSSNGQRNHSLKSVLVASLYPQYGDNLRSMYLSKPTVTGESIGVYQPSHEEKQKFYDNLHNMKAWIDMYLLSFSDVLVTTSLSTFGYVAQGLGGLKPWLLYRIVSNDTYFPACERDISMEPCYHIPPKHKCNGEVKENFAASFPNMCGCKDYSSGVKMVS